MLTNNIHEMDIDLLLHNFRERMQRLLKDETKKDIMNSQPPWVLDIIEDEVMPAVEKIVDWQPTDDEILAVNSCGTPWHDGCR